MCEKIAAEHLYTDKAFGILAFGNTKLHTRIVYMRNSQSEFHLRSYTCIFSKIFLLSIHTRTYCFMSYLFFVCFLSLFYDIIFFCFNKRSKYGILHVEQYNTKGSRNKQKKDEKCNKSPTVNIDSHLMCVYVYYTYRIYVFIIIIFYFLCFVIYKYKYFENTINHMLLFLKKTDINNKTQYNKEL